jgi:sulfate transport system ATP-binding protein
MRIEARGLVKRFGAFPALDGVDLTVGGGELVALLGPSGCGKTTLLRIIAGLESADGGTLRLDGEEATAQSLRQRRVGFVFQHYALFRHMTVFENIAFGLRVRTEPRRTEADVRRRVEELLALVRLESLAGRTPGQLSGGQRQRVALARALAVEPRVLLLDEPFGALDAQVRVELRRWLRRLHDEVHITSLFVTHDQEEALDVADRVVVMNAGRIEQVGTPDDIYHRPATAFVCEFLGNVNVLPGEVTGGIIRVGGVPVPVAVGGATGDRSVPVYVRPHELGIDDGPRGDAPDSFPATVVGAQAAGPVVRIELRTGWGQVVRAELSHTAAEPLGLRPGLEVGVRVLAGRRFA